MTAPHHLTLRLDRPAYAPGETVSGLVEIADGFEARELRVSLEYRDWTDDYHSVSRTVDALAPVGSGALQAGASLPFSLALPPDALPGQTGTFGQASWGVHARADRRGIDYHAWHTFSLTER